jgi:hypothetical protein
MQGGGRLDDALAGGVQALGPLPHPVLSASHDDSLLTRGLFREIILSSNYTSIDAMSNRKENPKC